MGMNDQIAQLVSMLGKLILSMEILVPETTHSYDIFKWDYFHLNRTVMAQQVT